MQFRALRVRTTIRGWIYDDYRWYNQIKVALQDSRQAEGKEHWGRKLANLAANYHDPRNFWREIKCLSGRTTEPNTYLLDHTNDKLLTNNYKERLFTNICDHVYSQDYDNDFDDNDQVLNYMATAMDRTYPYNNADPARLTGSSPLDCLISSCKLAPAIKRGRPTCPGESRINKTIFSYLPDSALSRVRAILNAALFAGYFSNGFKQCG